MFISVQRMDTGGDIDAMTLEFSVAGMAGDSRTAGSDPVIFNYRPPREIHTHSGTVPTS